MQIFMKIDHKKNRTLFFLCHWSMFLLQTVLPLIGNTIFNSIKRIRQPVFQTKHQLTSIPTHML